MHRNIGTALSRNISIKYRQKQFDNTKTSLDGLGGFIGKFLELSMRIGLP